MTQSDIPNGATLHPLVRAWLDRFEALTSQLSPERAPELRADIMEHLSAALGDNPSAERVQEVLRELGDPEDIVLEAAADQAPGDPGVRASAPAPPQPAQVTVWREVTALALLAAAPLLLVIPPTAVIAWIFGVALLWMSRIWTLADKLWGMVLAVVPAGVLVGGLFAFMTVACVETSGPVDGDVITGTELPDCSNLPPSWLIPLLFVILLGLAVYAFVRLALKTSRARAA